MRKKYLTALVLSGLLLTGCAPGRPVSGGSSAAGSSASVSQPDASRTEPGAAGVQVDWSRLEGKTQPRPDVDGGRWYPEYTDRLIPGSDYGTLVPYLGTQAYSFNRWEYEGETQEYFSDWPTSFYGLMTREGKIVVDPVYQYAISYSYRWDGQDLALPVLLLAQSDPAWAEFGTGMRYAVAAEDGSWTTGFEFLNYTNKGDQLFLLRPEGCTLLDSKTGVRKDWSWEELDMPGSGEELESALSFIQWAVGLTWLDEGVCLGPDIAQEEINWENVQVRVFQPETGEITWVEQSQWDRWYSGQSDRRWPPSQEIVRQGNQTGLTLEGKFCPLEDAPVGGFLESRSGDLILIRNADDGIYHLYRLSTGELLAKDARLELRSDLRRPGTAVLLFYDRGTYTACDQDLRPLFVLPPCSGDSWLEFRLRDGLLSFQNEGNFFGCYDLDAGEYIFFRNLGLGE